MAAYDSPASNTVYRNLQNSFISNLNGTTACEISLVTSFAPMSVLLRSLLWQVLGGNRETLEGIFSTSLTFLVEYITLVFPTFLIFTVLADYSFIFIVLLLFLAATGLIFRSNLQIHNQTLSIPIYDKRKRFLCNFRSYVTIATAISILAVDFTIFPRRFAKTETYGTGLMDVGVGSFMIANAVVCQDARGTTQSLTFIKVLKRELHGVLLLLGLGLARFAAVKTTDYQEHVSEYGVHWNFFLTLACVRVLSTIILRSLPEILGRHPWIIGVLIGLFYQLALVNGLENFILNGSTGNGSRTTFIDANREGICSCLGYVALYIIGVSVGKLIFNNKYDSVRSLLNLLLSLISIAVLCWITLWNWRNVNSSKHTAISRRLANFPFVLWMVGYNVKLLAFFLIVDILMVSSATTQKFFKYPGGCFSCSSSKDTSYKQIIIETCQVSRNTNLESMSSQDSPLNLSQHSSHTLKSRQVDNKTFSRNMETQHTEEEKLKKDGDCSCLITAVNYNLLAYFLIANLLTGFVNLCMETINVSATSAFIIMNFYLLLLHAVIMVFYRYKLLLKI